MIIPILQMWELRLREVKGLANQSQGWDFNPDKLAPKFTLLAPAQCSLSQANVCNDHETPGHSAPWPDRALKAEAGTAWTF